MGTTVKERVLPTPSLTWYDAPGTATGAVLLLHGGKARSDAEVTLRSLSWRRSMRLARDLREPLHEHGVALTLLRYRTVGWGDGTGKIEDATWALEQIRERHGEVPVAVLGHSMGGRTACRVADHDLVRGVVALAPWLPPSEPTSALRGRVLHAAHGSRDRITSAGATRAYVERAQPVASEATFTELGGLGHYLLRGVPRWNAFALDAVRRVLAAG